MGLQVVLHVTDKLSKKMSEAHDIIDQLDHDMSVITSAWRTLHDMSNLPHAYRQW